MQRVGEGNGNFYSRARTGRDVQRVGEGNGNFYSRARTGRDYPKIEICFTLFFTPAPARGATLSPHNPGQIRAFLLPHPGLDAQKPLQITHLLYHNLSNL